MRGQRLVDPQAQRVVSEDRQINLRSITFAGCAPPEAEVESNQRKLPGETAIIAFLKRDETAFFATSF